MNIYWYAQGETEVPAGDEWLGTAELAVLARLRIPKRRSDWRLGRWTAKRAVAAHLNLPQNAEALAAIEIRPASSGAPDVFLHDQPANVAISLSHSDGVGFCVVADAGAEIGCDVEKVAPRSASFISDYFTAAEQEFVLESPDSDRATAATLEWSAKESALKLLRCGLRWDTRAVSVLSPCIPLARSAAWYRLAVQSDAGRTFRGWWRESAGFVWTVLTSAGLPESCYSLGEGACIHDGRA